MATNAKKAEDETKESEAELTPEEDLDQARKELETKETEDSEGDAQSDESPEAEGTETEPDAALTTPQEPEKDLDWYKKAYSESTAEALRLKAELEKPPEPVTEPTDETPLTPEQLYIRQKQDEEISTAFADIATSYPQVKDPEEYKKFTTMANTFGRTILDAEKRMATPKELYAKTAIALGWADNSEKLGAALKDSAGTPRVSSGGAKAPQTSKVTDKMISVNRRWYPNKTDAEIREELEPHVQ